MSEQLQKDTAMNGCDLKMRSENTNEALHRLRTEEPDGDVLTWRCREEIEEHLCDAAARMAEAAGLIKPTDQFSWEWHCEMDPEIAEMAASQAGGEANKAENSKPNSNSEAQGHGDLGVGFTGSFEGDFNGNF